MVRVYSQPAQGGDSSLGGIFGNSHQVNVLVCHLFVSLQSCLVCLSLEVFQNHILMEFWNLKCFNLNGLMVINVESFQF